MNAIHKESIRRQTAVGEQLAAPDERRLKRDQ
jgi:hypothetical protein